VLFLFLHLLFIAVRLALTTLISGQWRMDDNRYSWFGRAWLHQEPEQG